MVMAAHIAHITIVRGLGADRVMLHTNLSDPCWPFTGQLALEFDAAEFCSEAYCREHWPGVAITVVPRA